MKTTIWSRWWTYLIFGTAVVMGCDAPEYPAPDRLVDTDNVLSASDESASAQETAARTEPVDLYPPDRLLDIALTLADEDWDKIRAEGRSTNEVYSGCLDPSFEYTTVSADVRVDGELFARVGLRKKGFLGSLSTYKPSLRVDFNAFDDRQTLHGQKDLTLNNSRSDSSLIRQCLAYHLFTAAGIPAPRCGFTQVSENGVNLGVYVNIEPMKKPFLRRHFRNPNGTLYEGSLHADFRTPNLARFEKKTNERDRGIPELERVVKALEQEGQTMLDALAPLVDIEQFYRFWAMETLTGHYNGYTGSLNNFMVYHDPSTQKLVFLPWGTDGSFARTNTYLPGGTRPVATSAWSSLAERLYTYPPTRQRYREVLRSLLDTVWNEPQILSEIERMAALLGSRASTSGLNGMRRFVNERRADIERELGEDVPWTLGVRPFAACTPAMNTEVRGSFSTLRDATAASDPETTLVLTLDGVPQSFELVTASVGRPTREDGSREAPSVTFVGRRADGGSAMVRFSLGTSIPTMPKTVMCHGFETSGSVYTWRRGDASIRFVGYIGKGKLVFEQAGGDPGSIMAGRFEGMFLQTQRSKLDEPLPTTSVSVAPSGQNATETSSPSD